MICAVDAPVCSAALHAVSDQRKHIAFHASEAGMMENTPISAAKVQKKVGQGYVTEHASTLPNITWLKQISSLKPLSEI